MPNTKSAEKRLRQDEVRCERNRAAKREVRTRCKKVLIAIEGGNVAEATELFREATKCLDQAAAKRVIHKNTAARSKSRLSARIKKAAGK
ncbi:MAG: 30S ribosomal protein S20 [Thermoguttaceae bacterium]|nr:30S ribosomal protein S20 [Thermoguttaceae bacterium]